MTPDFDTYVPPVMEDSDVYKPFENYGHACIVMVKEHKPSVVTPNSPNGAPAVIVDLVDMDGPGGGEEQIYRSVLMMTGAIVDGFKSRVGTDKPIVVSWGKRTSGSGRTYAAPDAATVAQIKQAEAWYATNGDPFAVKFETVSAEVPF